MTPAKAKVWHHTLAGALIVRKTLWSGGCDPAWVWPLVAGHHGCVPAASRLEPPEPYVQGRGAWPAAQGAFVDRVVAEHLVLAHVQVQPGPVTGRDDVLERGHRTVGALRASL